MEKDTLILSDGEKELVLKMTPRNDYYIGQIFEGSYPPGAAIWCNANNAYIDVIGDHRYEIKEVPPAPAPTREEIEKARIAYRHEHIDDETLCRLRKQANGTWTQEMEEEYLALDAEVTAYIEEHLPYPTDPIIIEEGEVSQDNDNQKND